MNKGLFIALVALATIASRAGNLVGLGGDEGGYRPHGPQGIPHKGRRRQPRPHAPNDGRWHMKFHRSRV